MPKKRRGHEGISIIELIVVVGIILLLSAAVAPLYGNLQVSAQLSDQSAELTQTIRLARERSVARLNNSSHGVKFETGQYTLYQGTSYLTRDTTLDRIKILESVLTLSTTISGNEVNFSKGLGMPSATGTVTLHHSIEGTNTITVNGLGTID